VERLVAWDCGAFSGFQHGEGDECGLVHYLNIWGWSGAAGGAGVKFL